MQLCPAKENAFAARRAAASSRSASAATMTGVAFPSSRLTRLRGARSRIPQPMGADPVNVISFTRSSSTRTSPISLAGPQTTFSQPGRQPGLELQLGEEERRERSLGSGLQHDRTAGCERGRHLVRDEVEREVERRDRADDPDRHAQRECQLPLTGRRRVHRQRVSRELPRLDRRHREGGDRTRRLHAGRLQGLPGLRADGARGLVVALREEPRDAIEDRRALVGRDRVAHGGLGGVERPPRLLGPGARDAPDERPVERRAHVDPLAGLDPLAADQQVLLGRGRGHAVSVVGALHGACARAASAGSSARRPLCCGRCSTRTSSMPSARRSGGGTGRSRRSARRSSSRRS